MKRLLPLLLVLCSMVSCVIDPIEEFPTYDTIYNYVDTIRVDTIRIDTLWHDTIIRDVNDKRVVAYCTYYGSTLPDPMLVTNINYAFAELYLSDDSVYQRFALQGSESRFRKVVGLKEQNPDLKISLSFSHTVSNSDNRQRGGFSRMAADPEQRHRFAEDCLLFCQQWGIDGIDIDWEFPGLSWSGYHCDPKNDTQNFTKLMEELRAVLGQDYLLTYAAYVKQTAKVDGGTTYIDNKAVEPYVDYINVMTYDMCSAPQPHNAFQCSGYFDINRMYNSYKAAKYPLEKINLGIAFYGRHTYEDGEWYYKNLMNSFKMYPSIWTYQFNEGWMTPVAYKNGEMWCSFDDERSISMKGEWANGVGLGGLMYWEISGDDKDYTLSRACWNAMKTHADSVAEFIVYTDTVVVSDTIVSIIERPTRAHSRVPRP